MAENVIAGSVPMAMATSILPAGKRVSGITDPPEVRAMISTAAALKIAELCSTGRAGALVPTCSIPAARRSASR